MIYSASSYNDIDFIIVDESFFTDIGRSINNAVSKFIKSVKDLILKAISFIENNVFTKNKFFYNNKDKIITSLRGKTFEGYLFRIFQDGYGAISKLESAVSMRTSDIILNRSYTDNNIMDYVRGLLLTTGPKDISYVEYCTSDNFAEKAKEYIYGSSEKGLHMVDNIYGGIDGMINRMIDKRANISKLRTLYKTFEKYSLDIIDTKKDHTDDRDLQQWIDIVQDHMKTCYVYMNIIIQAINDEYAQSYKLCTSALL